MFRIWISVETPRPDVRGSRFKYIFSPLAIADILAIVPFYLSALFSVDLRFLRILRLLRLFKLTRYSGALAGVTEVLRVNRGAFVSAFAMLFLSMIASSSVMYMVENEAQPVAFSSIPAAMWWAVVTLTTVGYGDGTPITPLGKMIAPVLITKKPNASSHLRGKACQVKATKIAHIAERLEVRRLSASGVRLRRGGRVDSRTSSHTRGVIIAV